MRDARNEISEHAIWVFGMMPNISLCRMMLTIIRVTMMHMGHVRLSCQEFVM